MAKPAVEGATPAGTRAGIFVDFMAGSYKRSFSFTGAMLNDRHVHALSGKVAVSSVIDEMLGRMTTRADIGPATPASGYGRGCIIDANLEWMATDGFELSGYEQVPAQAERPAMTLQQGWLCKPDWALVEQVAQPRTYRAPREER